IMAQIVGNTCDLLVFRSRISDGTSVLILLYYRYGGDNLISESVWYCVSKISYGRLVFQYSSTCCSPRLSLAFCLIIIIFSSDTSS
ncbi:MAG: hypothetical protein QN720_06440, partial [Nitrososphaeraceae archaeon]|nr:hypothetical protein [Nitrososphaeraceae archaeon]MDW0332576.1 hypothetical protein [Nitrososphaeraceae archaeon]